MALKTLTEKRNLLRTDNGNIGKERRDAKKQARRFGGIGQAGRAQKEQAADRICGNEYQLVSRIGQSARREWQALLQKIHRPGEKEKCEKISICDGDVGMGHGVNANFAPGVKFEVPNTNRLSSPFCDIFGASALRTFEPFVLPPLPLFSTRKTSSVPTDRLRCSV